MKRNCHRCSARNFEVPEFTFNEKKTLLELKRNGEHMKVVSKIRSLYNIDLVDAKFSLMHMNTKYGNCNRCNNDKLKEEYITCPKCKSLNFNWSV